jgi:hypothetical protein
MKSMFSSSTISAGSLEMLNFSLISLLFVFSNSINSESQSSSKDKTTLLCNSIAFFHFQ